MSLRLARLLGVLLIVYGLIGVMAGVTGYLAVRASFEQARALGSVLSDEEVSLRQDLAQVAATSGDAADAVDGFSTSLQQAQQSLATAGDAADQLSDGFQRATGLGTIEVFGMRPFADVGQSFGQSSAQFHTLAGELRATSEALGSNALDARRVGTDLRQIQDRVRQLATRVNVEAQVAGSLSALEQAVTWLLLWLLVQGLGWLAVGVVLLTYGYQPLWRKHRATIAPADRAPTQTEARRGV